MILLLFLSFFLSKIKVSGFCARCFSVVVVLFCCLRIETFSEKLKKFCSRKIKKKRNISSNTFCAQTFYNTAVTRALIKKGGERQNVNVCGGGGI